MMECSTTDMVLGLFIGGWAIFGILCAYHLARTRWYPTAKQPSTRHRIAQLEEDYAKALRVIWSLERAAELAKNKPPSASGSTPD